MEHKQIAEELEKGCERSITTPDMTSSCGDISFGNEILYCWRCREKRTEHKEEVMNGCEKEGCGDPVLKLFEKPKIQYCLECQEVLSRYKECGL